MTLNHNDKKYYNGNPNLKASGAQHQYNIFEIKEFQKCVDDPVYFINNYVKVISLDNGLVPFHTYPYQDRILKTVNQNRFTICRLFRQAGKHFSMDTKIPTPTGFKLMQDIHCGDFVLSPSGKSCKVVTESDPHYYNQYRITFDNGESINCSEQHLWTVKDRRVPTEEESNLYDDHRTSIYVDQTLTLTTKQLVERGIKTVNQRGYTEYNYYIPNTKPIDVSDNNCVIDPYALGLWLGDQYSDGNSIHYCEMDRDHYLKSDVLDLFYEQDASDTNKYIKRCLFNKRSNLSLSTLDQFNLIDNKHIPFNYIFCSKYTKVKLLQGLMDISGNVDEKRGICYLQFSLNHTGMLKTIPLLLNSLGLKVTVTDFEKTKSRRFSFFVSKDNFVASLIPRNYQRLSKTNTHPNYTNSRTIVNIENLQEKMYGKCIQVDSDDHLYLAGDIFVPTHNSTILAAYALWYACMHELKDCVILANKLAIAKEIYSRVGYMYENLPDFLKPGLKEYNKTSLTFDNGSKISASPTSASAIRGKSISLVILDEFAFVPATIANDFIMSIFPTLSSSQQSKMVIISCVTKDTFVFGKNGLTTIESFIDKDKTGGYYVDQYSVLGKGKFNQGNLMVNSGHTKTKIIKSLHSELECSLDHKLWVYKDQKYQWCKSKHLKCGDWIAIQYRMNVWGNNDSIVDFDYSKYQNKHVYKFDKITPNLVYLFGLYISKGYINDHQLCITCEEDIGFAFDRLQIQYTCNDNLHYIVDSACLCDLFRHLGLDTNNQSKEKIIPQQLLSMSRENIVALMQGLFDGDGSQTDKGLINYSSTSIQLINQIRMLLNNIGILASKHKLTCQANTQHEIYYLELNEKFTREFYNQIKFQLSRKQNQQRHINKPNISSDCCNVVPESVGVTCSIINDDLCDNVVSENIYWEQISEISDSENDVYDFSLNDVPNDDFCHSVIYNGIVGHQTPNGYNHFYKIWSEAEKGRNGFATVQGYWNEIHDQAWFDKQCQLLQNDPVKIKQELECSFLGSSSTLVESSFLTNLVSSDPIQVSDDKAMCYFEKPIANHTYVCTVDVSRGRGRDFSAVSIIDVTQLPYKVVATFKDNTITTLNLPALVYNLAKLYNDASILIENNDLGEQVCTTLWYDYEYENVIWTNGGQISGSGTIGVRTTKKVKTTGCNTLKNLIENHQLIINDFRIIQELSGFVRQRKGGYGAQDTTINDDLCATLWLFAWLSQTIWFQDYANSNAGLEIAKLHRDDVNQYLPFGFKSDGLDVLDRPSYQRLDNDQLDLLM